MRLLVATAVAALTAACVAAPPRQPDTDTPTAHVLLAEIALVRGQNVTAAEEYQLASVASSDPKLAGRAAQVALDSGRDD
ncbi:MAG: tetratricopeptide repeat protein, partial [Steroidobacterales bacterium]